MVMSTVRVIDVIRAIVHDPEVPDDGELVRRFVELRDEKAFAELLQRHGPIVFGVCRRVLGHIHDAEDAFQAVWLVLARRAADVNPPGSVGSFLYGVAVRTATKARSLAMKRRLRSMSVAKPDSVEDISSDQDLRAVLDEELARLPEKYRVAVVLCDVGGKSRSQAADELGWPEGTVADRVRLGREQLTLRLRKRGVVLTTLGFSVTVPPSLASETLAVALGSRAISPSVLYLMECSMRTVSATKVGVLVFVGVVLATATGVAIAYDPGAAPQPLHRVTTVEAREPVLSKPTEAFLSEWKESKTYTTTGGLIGSVAYSPDGRILILAGTGGHVTAYNADTQQKLWTYQFKATTKCSAIAFSLDGKMLAATFKHGIGLLDATTGKEIDTINEPESSPLAVGFFPERKLGDDIISNKVIFGNASGYFAKTWVKLPDTGTVSSRTSPKDKVPSDEYAVPLAVDPAGRSVILTGPIDRDTGKNVLWAWVAGNYDKGTPGNRILEGHTAAVVCAAWSKDGKTAVTGDVEGGVIVWDATTMKEISKVSFDRRIIALAVNTDGTNVAAALIANNQIEGIGEPAYFERVHVWNPKTETKRPARLSVKDEKALGGPFAGIGSIAFSPDGKFLAAGFCNFTHLSRTGELRGKVRVWQFEGEAKSVR